MTNQALIIFTRNPELGKCKTRLAATIGDQAALDIFRFLVKHTAEITAALEIDCFVYYSEELMTGDLWDDARFNKCVQVGDDLGQKMQHAFQEIFNLGYSKVGIIGSDLYDLTTTELSQGFALLETNEVVLGPAQDGGYYFLGLTQLLPEIFKDITWGTATVARETLSKLTDYKVAKLAVRNDVDYYSDIKDIPEFKPFIKHLDIHD